jgi:hypothetical protein
MNQSHNAEVEPSNENLPKLKQEDMSLSAIPFFTPSKFQSPSPPSISPSSSEPSLCEEGKYEYEFSLLWDGHLYFVYLYDTSDVSACERLLHRPVKQDELSYSDTGNGFVVDEEFRYTFKKNPYKRTYMAPDRKVDVKSPKQLLSADQILSSL